MVFVLVISVFLKNVCKIHLKYTRGAWFSVTNGEETLIK